MTATNTGFSQLQAEAHAKRLLYSAVEHGPTVPPLDIPPEIMPTPGLQHAARVIRRAWSAGNTGQAGVLGFAITEVSTQPEQDAIRAELMDICDCGFSEHPATLHASADAVRSYHRAERRRELSGRYIAATGNGSEAPDILAEIMALEAEQPECGEFNGFPLTIAGELEGTVEAQDFVEGLLTDGGASVVYGPSNCGKSFWTLDLAARVAAGEPFRGDLECEQGAVVYVALEGSHGARNRIEALKRVGRLPAAAPLYLCFSPVSLLEPGHTARLTATVTYAAEQSAMPCRLVILDTLARAMGGGDENKGQDMGTAVASMDSVRLATGAHVLLVHHCGKNEALGARGHSSLRAAVDTEIEISRADGENISTVRVTKQRDMPTGDPMPFSLESVMLGLDRRGKPITSCVVRHEDAIMASLPGKSGRKVEVQPERLLDLLPQPSTTAWQKRADDEMGVSKSTFYRNLDKLKPNSAKQLENGGWDRAKP
jgi:hypothetical protein